LSARFQELGIKGRELADHYRLFNNDAPAFREESKRHG
jgi:hypothetical protein